MADSVDHILGIFIKVILIWMSEEDHTKCVQTSSQRDAVPGLAGSKGNELFKFWILPKLVGNVGIAGFNHLLQETSNARNTGGQIRAG